MSKRHNKMTILGPDGKPLDLARLATERHEKRVAAQKAQSPAKHVSLGGIDLNAVMEYTLQFGAGGLSISNVASDHEARRKDTLADRVAADVDALTATFDGAGVPELPRPAPDLTAYTDAYEQAIRTCPHDNITSTIYARGEYQCQECGKYLDSDDLRRRNSGSAWGWFR